MRETRRLIWRARSGRSWLARVGSQEGGKRGVQARSIPALPWNDPFRPPLRPHGDDLSAISALIARSAIIRLASRRRGVEGCRCHGRIAA